MTCEDVERLGGAYADGELDLADALAIEAHAAGCVACAARLQAGRTLSRAIAAAPYFAAPAGLVSRIRGQGSVAGAVRLERRSPRVSAWLVAAASLAVGVLGTALVFRGTQATETDRTAQAVVASHVRSLMAAHLTDVASSDRHTVKPWFAGRINFSPPVVDLAADGFPLTGGRLDYFDGHPAVALVYTRGAHVINVFAWPAPQGATPPQSSDDPLGYHLVHWIGGGFTWWVVSDVAPDDLRAFAKKLSSQ